MTSAKRIGCTLCRDISRHFRVRLSYKFSNISCCSHFCLQSPCLTPRCCGSERGFLKGSWATGVQCCGVVSLLLTAFDLLVLEPQGLVQIESLGLLLLVGCLPFSKCFPSCCCCSLVWTLCSWCHLLWGLVMVWGP